MNENKINDILNIAYTLDIDEVGFTNKTDFSYLKNDLKYRIDNNVFCEFEEKNIELRLNTNSVMRNCNTIIAAIFPYFQGYAKQNKQGFGKICSSSVGEDYHLIVKKRLEEFASKISEIYDFSYEICVDSNYLLDKEICKNAKLGYIGKNSLLINKKYGSFVFLGYILTDLNINDDEVQKYSETKLPLDSCGDCKSCINNCPNNALSNEGKMNVKKCLSYLTQTKEIIPIKYRKAMGSQIYGCDVCQLICPKNIFAYEQFCENDELYVDIEELLTISKKEFKTKYSHLAAAWRGKNIWKRNAIIVAANTNRIDLYDLIKKDIDNPSPMIKYYASWCIDELERKKNE